MEFGKIIIYCLQAIEFWLGFCLLFPEMLSRDKSDFRKKRIIIISIIVSGVYAYNGSSVSWISVVMTLLFPIIIGILFAILCKKYTLITMVWTLSYLIFVNLLKLAVLLWEGIENQKNIINVNRFGSDTWIMLTELVLNALLLVSVYWVKREKISIRRLCKQCWWVLLLADIVEYKLINYVMENCVQEIQKPYLVINFCGVLLIILGLFTMLILNMVFQIKSERNLLIVSQNMQNNYQMQLQKQYDEMAKKNHDVQHERNYIIQCLKTGRGEEAQLYLEEKAGMIYQGTEIWTGHKFMDFLISIKKRDMDLKHILFRLYSDFMSLPISESEFGIVLGNLLDNAIEAAEKCELDKRWIQVDLIGKGCTFQLKVKNASVELPRKRGEEFCTTKKEKQGHGWGLKNVEEIVGKWKGTVKYTYTESTFEVLILFYVSI